MSVFDLITAPIAGIQGASAAHNAANAQVAGYGKAADTVNAAVGAANPIIGNATNIAGQNLVNTATDVNSNAGTVAGDAGNRVMGAANDSGDAGAAAIARSEGLSNPYLTLGNTAAGQLGQLTAPGANVEEMMKQLDPGYNFRLQQGMQGVAQSAAGAGLLQSGAAARGLNNYAQGFASNEYNNTFNRLKQLTDLGSTTSQYLGSQGVQNSQFEGALRTGAAENSGALNLNAAEWGGNELMSGTAQAGQWGIQGANTQAQNLINAGVYTGNTQIGSGNAIAQGDIGAANSWNNMLNGISNGAGSALGMWMGGWGAGPSKGTGNGIDPGTGNVWST